MSEDPCSNCGAPAKSRCGRCKVTAYCSTDCLRQHFPIHRVDCPTEAAIGRSLRKAILVGGWQQPEEASCYICLEGSGRLIHVRCVQSHRALGLTTCNFAQAGCACRGGQAGFVHPACLLEAYDHVEALDASTFKLACPTCLTTHSGEIKVRQLQKLWRLSARHASNEVRIRAAVTVALVLEEFGEHDEALRQYGSARAAVELVASTNSNHAEELRVCEARMLAKADRHVEAVSMLQAIVDKPRLEPVVRLQATAALATSLALTDRYIEAEHVARTTLNAVPPCSKYPRTRRLVVRRLAFALLRQGKMAEAADHLVPCARAMKRDYGPDHPETGRCMAELNALVLAWKQAPGLAPSPASKASLQRALDLLATTQPSPATRVAVGTARTTK